MTSGHAVTADEGTWLRLLAEASTEGIFVHEGGRILRVNTALARMWGYTADEMVGMSGTDLVPDSERARLIAHIASNTEQPFDGFAKRKDGTTFPARVRGRSIVLDGRTIRVVLMEDLSERRRVEAELKAREIRARALMEHLPAVVWTTDVDMRLMDIEGLVQPPTKPPNAGQRGQRVEDQFGADDDPRPTVDAHARALQGDVVVYQAHRGGRTYQAHVEPLRGSDNEIVGVIGVAIDITDQLRTREQAREADERLRLIAEHLQVVFWVVELQPTPHVSYVSPAFEQLWGFPASEVLARPDRWLDAVHPEDRARVEEAARIALPTGVYDIEYRIVHTGDVRWIADRGHPVRDASGTVTRVTGSTVDVTAYKEIQAALGQRERELRSLADNVPEIIARFDASQRVLFMNAAVERFSGRSSEEFVGKRIEELDCPQTLRAQWREALSCVFANAEPTELTWELRGLDDTIHSIHTRVVPELTATGHVASVLTTSRDETERLRAEARFRALVDNASDLILILDPSGISRYVSPSHERVLGVSAARLTGRNCFKYVHRHDRDALTRLVQRALTEPGPTPASDLRVRDSGGAWRTLSCIITDMRADPSVGGLVSNSRDVTAQRRLESQLRQSQKMEAVGQLAGGVAHDFNNILAAINGYAQLLHAELSRHDPRSGDVHEILKAAERGAAVTRQLLAFSRRQAMELEELDLAAVVRETGRMLRPLLPASIELELPPDSAPTATVRASRAQLEQIVLNLALNARDAMPQGGALALRVHREERRGNGIVIFQVADTGVGIPESVRSRVFEPFFTTKPQGQGTGLGLATVYGLVQQFGGSIAIASEEGRGTTFTVELPASSGEADRDASGPPPRQPLFGNSGRVLLVEDEPQVRAVARRMLAGAGYEVLEAAHGRAALDRLAEGEHVDVIVSDAAMPVMSGRDLAAAVAERYPGLPVVMMSGYAELSGVPHASDDLVRTLPGVHAFVEKPFSAERLLTAVARAQRARPT